MCIVYRAIGNLELREGAWLHVYRATGNLELGEGAWIYVYRAIGNLELREGAWIRVWSYRKPRAKRGSMDTSIELQET